MIQDLRVMLLRDLATLAREVDLYPDDGSLWKAVPGLANAGGNLALHLCGNLRHFIGATLGGTGYVRDRDAEFADRDLAKAALLAEIQATHQDVDATLSAFPPARLQEPFPIAFAGQHLGTGAFLLHLASHLAFHLGQVDYHRRAATGEARGAGAVAISELLPPAAGA